MTSRQNAPRRGGMVRNIMHLGLGQVATTILSILLSATLARKLSSSDFGLLYLVQSIATFTYVIVDWGYGPLIIRETARHPEKSGDLLGSASAARICAALAGCLFAVAITWMLGYDVRTRVLTGALILCWLPQYLGLSFGWVFRAVERMECDAALNVVLKLSTFVGAIGCLALGGQLLALVLTWAVAGGLTLSIAITIYKRLHLPAIRATMSTARDLVRDGAPLLAISLAVAIEPAINSNILYKMTSPAVVGWLGAAGNIGGTLLAPASILVATMFPRLSMAAGDTEEFKRAFDMSFRLLLLFAVLGAVGTYLFADVAVGLIYTLQKFGPAVSILRAFAPVLLLMYVDMYLTTAVLAAGKAGRLALAKATTVGVSTGLAFVLIPICQARFANGGLGVMYAIGIGEVVMLTIAIVLLRETIDRRTIGDVCRTLISGAATVLLIRLLPTFAPIFAIPICVLAFGGLSLLFGAVRLSEVGMLLASFRRRSPIQR